MIECQQSRIDFRLRTKYLDKQARDLDEALLLIAHHTSRKEAVSIGLCGNAAEIVPELVKRAKAVVTPEAAVFLNGGRLVYHGRIDNRYVVLGKERPEATEHDLESFLQAVVDAKPLPGSSKPAVGCYIAER